MTKQYLLIVMLFLAVGSSVSWSKAVDSEAILLAKVDFTIEHAVKRVKKQFRGKVLKAEKIKSKGPVVFKVKVLTPKGRVKNVFVDGVSGEVFEP